MIISESESLYFLNVDTIDQRTRITSIATTFFPPFKLSWLCLNLSLCAMQTQIRAPTSWYLRRSRACRSTREPQRVLPKGLRSQCVRGGATCKVPRRRVLFRSCFYTGTPPLVLFACCFRAANACKLHRLRVHSRSSRVQTRTPGCSVDVDDVKAV